MDPASYRISEKAVERVAEVAVLSVPGVREIDAKLAGLAGRSFPRVEAQIDRPASSVILDVEIVSSYPAPVGAITDEVRQTVGSHVETLTGLAVQKVNIVVVDAEATALGERVTRNDLLRHPTGVAPAEIRVSRSAVTSPVVKAPIALAAIEADDTFYRNLAPVDMPAPPQIEHVTTPPPPRPQPVEAPAPNPVAHVETPEPVRPFSPARPDPAPLRAVSIARPTQPRHVSAPAPASLKRITVNQYAPRIPVERPAPQPLRLIEVSRPSRPAPVSLPAQRPLAHIQVERPRHVDVVKPMPKTLRAITVPPLNVVDPQVPPQRPLEPITIDPDYADDHALERPLGENSTQTVRIRPGEGSGNSTVDTATKADTKETDKKTDKKEV